VKVFAWSIPAVLAGLAMSATNACAAPTVTYFDVPGGSVESTKIDNAGEISGAYLGSDGNVHGYRRTTDGTITTFDAPGGAYTVPQDISKGVITGQYFSGRPDGLHGATGFILPSNGPAIVFSVGSGGATYPQAINNGVVIGEYAATEKATYLCCGFVRLSTGVVKHIRLSGSVQTEPMDINSSGVITGCWSDEDTEHGFIRSADGAITSFDEPNGNWTVSSSIQADGIVAGTYLDDQNLAHGFIRSTSGAFTTVDVPDARYTDIESINNNGWVAGIWSQNADGGNGRGYVRKADGKIEKFSIEQATFTWLLSINSANVAAGFYVDQQNVGHGVIVTP